MGAQCKDHVTICSAPKECVTVVRKKRDPWDWSSASIIWGIVVSEVVAVLVMVFIFWLVPVLM